jgi:hypothetical protein
MEEEADKAPSTLPLFPHKDQNPEAGKPKPGFRDPFFPIPSAKMDRNSQIHFTPLPLHTY